MQIIKPVKPKAHLGTKKPIDKKYAEVLRLRQIIAEIKLAKAARDDRASAK
jgi:hypothetical protein